MENVLHPLALAWRFEFYSYGKCLSVPDSVSFFLYLMISRCGRSFAPRQVKLTQCYLLIYPRVPEAVCSPFLDVQSLDVLYQIPL